MVIYIFQTIFYSTINNTNFGRLPFKLLVLFILVDLHNVIKVTFLFISNLTYI